MKHGYDKSENEAAGVTSNARLQGQSVASNTKYAEQSPIRRNAQGCLSPRWNHKSY